MRYIKNIKYLFLTFICFVTFISSVNAAGVSVKSSSSSVTKGSTVTITATVSSSSPIVSIEGNLSCSGAGVSGGTSLTFDDSSNSVYSKSFTHTVKATSSGTITCTVSGARITDMSSDDWQSLGGSSVSVTVKEPTVIQKPTKEYSSNNNLKALEMEGYDLSPTFSKDTKEYNVEVPNDTEKVIITATKEDSGASVSGAGEVKVTEGLNKIEIKVTAENGNEKVYVINVTVKELDPIEVTIDKKKFTVIRKEGVLEPPENYEKSSVKIGNDDVLCYKNNVTKRILIGLKDQQGNARYYLYDEKNNKYSLYHGYKIGGIYLNILEMPKDMIPSDYVKKSFEYNGNKIDGYVLKNGNSNFYLIYAENEITGKKGLYIYDKLENTVQRFNDDLVDIYKKKADNYFLYFLISIIVLAITIITFSIILIRKKNGNTRISHKKRLN